MFAYRQTEFLECEVSNIDVKFFCIPSGQRVYRQHNLQITNIQNNKSMKGKAKILKQLLKIALGGQVGHVLCMQILDRKFLGRGLFG